MICPHKLTVTNMNAENEYLTKEKFEALEKELEHLKTTKRKEIAEALEYAKSLGDLSENQEYHEARDSQAVVEDRINRLESILKTAAIVSTHDTSIVNVGTQVTLEKIGTSARITYSIVGSEEADASQGKISVRSPLGTSALGKKKGDVFSFQTPGGTMSYKIIDIK
jgi:transcription elongation factor GreA